jgi:hypothetical protein
LSRAVPLLAVRAIGFCGAEEFGASEVDFDFRVISRSSFFNSIRRHGAGRAWECHTCGYSVSECDVEGKEILHDVFSTDGTTRARLPRQILNSEETRAAIARGTLICNRRTKFGKKLVRLIETAEKHETERAAAIERSGLDDAMTRQFEAAYEIEKLAFEAFEIEPRTVAGALIQARALNACADTELLIYYRSRSAQLFGNALAQSLTRLSNFTVTA